MTRLPRLRTAAVTLIVTVLGGCGPEPNADYVPVLLYHQVSPDPADEPGETLVSRRSFEEQMRYLADNGYTTVTVSEVAAYMRGERTLPPNSVALTFNEGWASALHAVAVLQSHGLKATFLIVTGPVDDRLPGYLSWTQLRGLAADTLFEFGAHSVSHPWLEGDNLVSWLEGRTEGRGREDVLREIRDPHDVIAAEVNADPQVYAWPGRWQNQELVRLALASGYSAILSLRPGVATVGGDPADIPRLTVDGRYDLNAFVRLLRGDTTVVDAPGPRGGAPRSQAAPATAAGDPTPGPRSAGVDTGSAPTDSIEPTAVTDRVVGDTLVPDTGAVVRDTLAVRDTLGGARGDAR